MKNVNLTGLFLAMVAKFGVNSFELYSIVPYNGEPIDALITFKGSNATLADIDMINEIVDENITGEVKQSKVTITIVNIQVYIEFEHKFIDELA